MNTEKYFKILKLVFISVIALFYLAAVFVAGWNFLAPPELCWLGDDQRRAAGLSLIMLPFITALTFVFLVDK